MENTTTAFKFIQIDNNDSNRVIVDEYKKETVENETKYILVGQRSIIRERLKVMVSSDDIRNIGNSIHNLLCLSYTVNFRPNGIFLIEEIEL